jgi:hypothetical protein
VHFYFDIENSDGVVADDTGLELDDLDAAQREALLSLPAIAGEGRGVGRTTMRIREGSKGKTLCTVTLTMKCNRAYAHAPPPAAYAAA